MKVIIWPQQLLHSLTHLCIYSLLCTHCSYSTIITRKVFENIKLAFMLIMIGQTTLSSSSFIFTITFTAKIISIVYNCLWLFITLHIAAWGQSAHFCVRWSPLAMHLLMYMSKTSIPVLHLEPVGLHPVNCKGSSITLSWSHPFSIGLGISGSACFPSSCLVAGTLAVLAHAVSTRRELVPFNLCLFGAEQLVPVSTDIRLLTFWHHTMCK